ncbi:hypothetical protein, partial [Sphingobium chlorophenolicum]|uniref:hypothetical protein n=1 Tax=Sphingobium chlorophenolicum TaxID=46429 RepID=UPI001C3FE3F5
ARATAEYAANNSIEQHVEIDPLKTFDTEIPSFRCGSTASRVHEGTNGAMPSDSIYVWRPDSQLSWGI